MGLQLHLSSSLLTASSHNLSPRTHSLPSRLLLGQKYLSPSSRHSRPSRLNLSRNNSSLASPSSLNSHPSRPELPSPHRGDPRWSTRCSTPAVSSPRISQLRRTMGMVSTSPILPFCDCIYLYVLNISHRSCDTSPGKNNQCGNKSRQPSVLNRFSNSSCRALTGTPLTRTRVSPM